MVDFGIGASAGITSPVYWIGPLPFKAVPRLCEPTLI
jgi:hypothetical protein